MDSTPFHSDELAAQVLAGGGAKRSAIRDFMPEQHRTFFSALPYIFVGTLDVDGWPVATLLEGDPGFVEPLDPVTLRIHALPSMDDPAAGTIHVGQEIGILGIDLATRRRNRANGVVSDVGTAFTVAIKQSFGNCPQYIQRRAMQRVQGTVRNTPQRLNSLDKRARELIERADTFFVASRSRAEMGTRGGADISHRGGRPGFVLVDGDTLSIPDFPGNRYFNTLGNLVGEPRASLLFVDFDSGDLLQLQGITQIDWSGGTAKRIQGAERLWHFQIVRGWYRPQATVLRGSFIDYSPVTLVTGTWAGDPAQTRFSVGTVASEFASRASTLIRTPLRSKS
jgi:predicted pyridoxine 5'-phosphate oxidase superfamily flavin-nucleotide-binding protein